MKSGILVFVFLSVVPMSVLAKSYCIDGSAISVNDCTENRKYLLAARRCFDKIVEEEKKFKKLIELKYQKLAAEKGDANAQADKFDESGKGYAETERLIQAFLNNIQDSLDAMAGYLELLVLPEDIPPGYGPEDYFLADCFGDAQIDIDAMIDVIEVDLLQAADTSDDSGMKSDKSLDDKEGVRAETDAAGSIKNQPTGSAGGQARPGEVNVDPSFLEPKQPEE